MTKPIKTVPATCACGVVFQREVKRGRPQIWCPSCVLKPFYERTVKTVPTCGACGKPVTEGQHPGCYTTNDPLEVVIPERIINENDRLDSVRVDIEARMVEINADHKVRFAVLVASGLSPFDAATKAQADTLAASQNLYAEMGPKWYAPGREVDDA